MAGRGSGPTRSSPFHPTLPPLGSSWSPRCYRPSRRKGRWAELGGGRPACLQGAFGPWDPRLLRESRQGQCSWCEWASSPEAGRPDHQALSK